MKKFGQALNQIRKGNCLTQKKVSDLVGISTSYLSQLERSKRTPPSVRLILKLSFAAQATDLQRTELLNLACSEMGLKLNEAELPSEVQELILAIRKNANHIPLRFFKALTAKIREVSK